MRSALASAALLVLLTTAAPTGAAVPGTDGRVLFSSGGDLHSVLPDGSGIQALTTTPDVEEAQASWSPDGSRVAFRVGRAGTTDVIRCSCQFRCSQSRIRASRSSHQAPSSSPSGRSAVLSGAA